MLKTWLKKYLLPLWLITFARPYYHGFLALSASVYYGRPSNRLVVIGVTGTAGKSTTAAMLSHIFNHADKKCGYITTVNFFDGEKDYINKHGLSMPGGPLLQKQLRKMLDNGCKYSVVECTSEGLAQNRHAGINFDVALFTNLSEAHIETHGSFKNYRAAKGKLFKTINTSHLTTHKKQSNPQIKKSIGVNLDDVNADYFLGFAAEKKFGITFHQKTSSKVQQTYSAQKSADGFNLQDAHVAVKVVGEFNLYNALLATACSNVLGIDLKTAMAGLSSFIGIRGRMESVENMRRIKIYVDYGCEPATIRAALLTANALPHNKIIHVFGATGGHRDVAKRFVFGQASAELADISIITNDDVYDSNPEEIANNCLQGFNNVSLEKRKAKEVCIILDRRQAIKRALEIAQAGDFVLVTGKGSEQFLVLPGNKRIAWDEVRVIKEILSAT